MPFLMIRNDITKVAADAIVNPANRNLLQGSGTSRGIYQAAGEQELTAAAENPQRSGGGWKKPHRCWKRLLHRLHRPPPWQPAVWKT